jgi:hypothetical protein
MRTTAALFALAACLVPTLSRAEPDRDPAAQPDPDAPRSLTARHRFGVQVGGSGIFQVVYRLRALGPVHLDVGAFGAPHGIGGSGGLVADLIRRERWTLYVGGGIGAGAIIGSVPVDGCDASRTDCERMSSAFEAAYGHARAGVAIHFGARRRHSLGLDLGVWHGVHRDREDGEVTERDAFTIPMAGASYLFAL